MEVDASEEKNADTIFNYQDFKNQFIEIKREKAVLIKNTKMMERQIKDNEETIIEEQATLRLLLCTTQANYEWEQIGRKWNKILKRLILHGF